MEEDTASGIDVGVWVLGLQKSNKALAEKGIRDVRLLLDIPFRAQ